MNLPSLYPYLNPDGANFYLKFFLISEDLSILEKAPYPFLVVSDSDPLTRLVEAKFVTDEESEIKRVFLLIQRDRYLFAKDELWPINNKNIEESWQKAFSFYLNKKHYYSFITFGSQMNQTRGLTPLRSLFFCKKTRAFFHPPCPKCGLPLQQCYDDELLTNSGLLAYSTSLKRYLFCPSCFALEGKSDFYVYEFESLDPPALKNRWDLIRAFCLLLEKKDSIEKRHNIEDFPCLECPDNKNCYGTYDEVISKIVPFSFYPFFMFIFESMSLNAIDFLSLISGGSFKELEARLLKKQELGRIQCLKRIKEDCEGKFFFPIEKDKRSFLEVLYLKLSFLGALIKDIFSLGLDIYKHPDIRLSLDHIWIKFPDLHGLLPFFWDFNIKFIDIMRGPVNIPPFPKLPQSNGLYFLSLVWFHTLLVNKKQAITKVYYSLGELIKTRDIVHPSLFYQIIKEGSIQTFLPENIFWNPEEKDVTETWHTLWERSLGLGWTLLKASLNSHFKWSKEEFYQKIETLREEVKDKLFQGIPSYEAKAYPMENEAIQNILMKILDKWHKNIKLKTSDLKANETDRQELDRTVIISPKASQEKPPELELRPENAEKKSLDETIVISPKVPQKKPVTPDLERHAAEKEGLEKTVVISPEKGFKDLSGSSQKYRAKNEEAQEGETSTTKTVDSKDDDFFTETIILTPDQIKDKEKKEKNE